jgi:hypothetical protein
LKYCITDLGNGRITRIVRRGIAAAFTAVLVLSTLCLPFAGMAMGRNLNLSNNGRANSTQLTVATGAGELTSGLMHEPVPTSIEFTILNTEGCGNPSTYQFFLNGTNIGSVTSTGICSCGTPTQTYTVSNAALLAATWSDHGPNSLSFTKTYGAHFAWIKAKVNFDSGPALDAYFDFAGGNATATNLCSAGYTEGDLAEGLGNRYYPDADGDGFGSDAGSITSLDRPAGYIDRGGDWDDTDNTVYPGAPEVCDGKDNDGDGLTDEGTRYYRDADGDGFGDQNVFLDVSSCSTPPASGYVTNKGDCDDTDPSITNNCKALINEETVAGGANSAEAIAAVAQGFQVTVVSGATWSAMTASEFGEYKVIIAGDPYCSGVSSSFTANAAVWAPVIMGTAGGRTRAGNRVLVGTDPVTHGANATNERGSIIRTGIAFAAKQPNTTGLYFNASCDYSDHVATLATLSLLSTGTGAWSQSNDAPCGGSVSLIASEPSFTELTSSSLEGWSCSVHDTFPTFPTDWAALAVATDSNTHPVCGVDPNTGQSACGEAYILIAGSSVVVTSGSISVTPLEVTNPVNTSHVVTAHLTSNGAPLVNQLVNFTITGQNQGAAGSCAPAGCLTDSNGDVSFVYTGANGPGDDTIKASFTDATGSLQAATAQVHWENIQTQATATATDGGGSYNGTAYLGTGTCSDNLTPVITYSGGTAPVNAGTTSFTVTCGDGGINYIDGTATGSIVITKAAVTATAGSGSNVFDGSAHSPSACVVSGAYTGALSCANDPATVGPGVGTTVISPVTSGSDLANFTVTNVDGSYSITQATSTVTVTCPVSEVYNGAAHTPCTAGYTTSDGQSGPLTVSYTDNTNAGTAGASASYAGDANHAGNSNSATFTIAKAASQTTVTCSPNSVVYNGTAQTPCSAAVTGVGGLNTTATPSYVNNTNVGTATAGYAYSGDANHNGSAGSATFAITKAPSAMTVTAPAFISNGGSATISGTLTGVSNAPLAGESVTFSIGGGTGTQSCVATTNASGAASCTITGVNQPIGPNLPVTTAFAGNSNYNGSGASTTTFVYSQPGSGQFVVGDLADLSAGATVNFWGSQWSRNNPMSGGAAPNAFKGFENGAATPTCGQTWTSQPGNSSNPPATVPEFMTVLVSSSITKNGSVISGNVKRVVVVQTQPGYGPAPGHTGNGKVIAILCSQ